MTKYEEFIKLIALNKQIVKMLMSSIRKQMSIIKLCQKKIARLQYEVSLHGDEDI